MKKDKGSKIIKSTVYLSLGSNLGDRLINLREGMLALAFLTKMKFVSVSSIYETQPVGLEDQPLFFNIAACFITELTPRELLDACLKIENKFSRDRSVRWGPRPLDIDILTYDDIIIDEPDLTIPHPRMKEREFVQIPLQELISGEISCTESVRPVYSNWFSLPD